MSPPTAMPNTPHSGIRFPDRATRVRALRAIFSGMARDAIEFGSAYGAQAHDGRLQGVAPSGSRLGASHGERGGRLVPCPGSSRYSRQLPGRLPTFMRTGVNAACAHPPDLHCGTWR